MIPQGVQRGGQHTAESTVHPYNMRRALSYPHDIDMRGAGLT